MRCNRAWIANLRRYAYVAKPSSIRTGRSKHGWGATHFLTKTLARVSTEMSLHVLAYNLNRVVKILGVRAMIGAIRGSGKIVGLLLATASVPS